MKLAGFVITALVVGLSGTAFAQAGSGQQAAANPPAAQAAATSSNQAPVVTSSDGPRNWMATGYIGSNFSSTRTGTVDLDLSRIENLDANNSTSVNYGFQVAYVGRGVIGGEFLADFSPGLGIFNNALFTQAPDVNSYMFNLIAVAPFGHAHTYDPYLSGGIGSVSLKSTIFTVDPTVTPHTSTAIRTEDVSGSRFGWNLGGGFMAWSEKNWGFRADVRYYATTSGSNTEVFDIDNIGDGAVFSRVVLSGISFWKVNAGMGFRW
jgi:hypothetical protein